MQKWFKNHNNETFLFIYLGFDQIIVHSVMVVQKCYELTFHLTVAVFTQNVVTVVCHSSLSLSWCFKVVEKV